MAATAAERQRKFRLSQKGKTRKLEILLPDNEFTLLHDNAKQQGLTKAKYIVSLLHSNSTEQQAYHDRQIEGRNILILETDCKNKALEAKIVLLTKQGNIERTGRMEAEAELAKANAKDCENIDSSRKPRTKITPAMKDEIIVLLIEGKPHEDIADVVGVSRWTVGRIKKEYLEK
jgi:hypothetical protein